MPPKVFFLINQRVIGGLFEEGCIGKPMSGEAGHENIHQVRYSRDVVASLPNGGNECQLSCNARRIGTAQYVLIVLEAVCFHRCSRPNVWVCVAGLVALASSISARCALNAAPELFSAYSAFFMIIGRPASDPNSGPAAVQHFSRQSAVKYAF
jgi:hypothetical protein